MLPFVLSVFYGGPVVRNTTKSPQHNGNKLQHNEIGTIQRKQILTQNEISTTQWKQAATQRLAQHNENASTKQN